MRIFSWFLVPLPLALSAGTFACSTNESASADAGGVDSGYDASNDASPLSTFDAGTPPCISDGGFPRPSAVPAFGSFSGADAGGDICSGGAFAYLERTSGSSSTPSQVIFLLDTALSGDPTTFIHFANPSNATGGDLTVLSGVSEAAPGTYGSADGSCGDLAFCISFPTPPDVDCGDAGSPSSCPPGCVLTGPISGPVCTPATPENCYGAQGASDCVLGTQAPSGSWILNLTSVTPYAGASSGTQDYVVHGTFTSTMDSGDAGLGDVSLSMSF